MSCRRLSNLPTLLAVNIVVPFPIVAVVDGCTRLAVTDVIHEGWDWLRNAVVGVEVEDEVEMSDARTTSGVALAAVMVIAS